MSVPRWDASKWPDLGTRVFGLFAVAVIAAQVVTLVAMGHALICTCGYVELWHSPTAGPGTSQHLTDWYTFTHLVHGFLFYLLLWLVAPGAPFRITLVVALGFEAVWEIIENTPAVIERYRETALAAGYFGDSVINSLTDTLAMVLGFVMARRMPLWGAVGFVIGLELLLAVVIRDNLLLNIVQLIHPVEAISAWQAGG